MDRRNFVLTILQLLAGGWLTLPGAVRVLAHESVQTNSLPKVALIIDDIGYDRRITERFLSLDIPITYAVLPRLRQSCSLSALVRASGHEVMLHQPMEPIDANIDPGPGALYVKSRLPEIDRIVEENLASVPDAVGVNNHMGSRFTQIGPGMAAALGVVRSHGLFFVDSLTTNRSVAHNVARHLGIPSGRRNVFLDNLRDERAILGQLRMLARQARQWGRAVGIGHPFPETVSAIARFCGNDCKKILSWVYASEVMEPGIRQRATST